VTNRPKLRAVPVDDRAWLLAALADALKGGAPVLPVPPGLEDAEVQRLQALELPADTAVLVRTSGSSGVPKAVALSSAALRASANATHERLGGDGQWLITLPAHLISGLQMLVRSQISGIEPIFFDSAFEPEAFFRAAQRLEHERRYVSLVPVQLSRLLDYANHDTEAADLLRSFSAVLVGGQAVPLAVRQHAHELGIELRRSYGMTETAGGCVYDGVEIGDTRMRIRDGEVQLAGASLALGYGGDEALTAERFITEAGVRWYRTGDAGELLGGMLTVTGRLDRVLISGGINVSLDEVERVIRELPGWADTVALAVNDADWGERVVLVRETGEVSSASAPDDAATDETARHTLREQLGVAAVPVAIHSTPELPRLTGGKPDMIAIAARLGQGSDSDQ